MKTLEIRMKGEDVAEVDLFDVIGEDPFFGGGISSKAFRKVLKDLKAKTLNLRVNSPGGSVIEGAAMLAALDDWKAKGRRIEADVDGLAASAASVLLMAGDKVRVASNGLVMIHDPTAGVMGGAQEMRQTADLLDKVKGQILDAYQRKSKAGRDQLAAWMEAETWFTGQEAVAAGLADETTQPVRLAACAARWQPLFAKLHYRHVPDAAKPEPADVDAHRGCEARLAAYRAALQPAGGVT